MSSGRFTSSLFSCSFFKTTSSVLSTGGLGTFSCVGFFSSCEPKLFGSVLLRWRVSGGKSSSDFSSLCSGERSNVDWWSGWQEWAGHRRGGGGGVLFPFSSFRSLDSSVTQRSTSGFAALSLCDGCRDEKKTFIKRRH